MSDVPHVPHAPRSLRATLLPAVFLALACIPVFATDAATIPAADLGARADALLAPGLTRTSATPAGVRLAAPLQDLAGSLDDRGLAVESVSSSEGGGRLTLRPRWLGRADGAGQAVPDTGTVSRAEREVRLARSGLGERLTAGGDGLRPELLLEHRPAGAGDLRLELALAGARAEPVGDRARLILDGSGRALAYGPPQVTDSVGQELTARLHVAAPDRIVLGIDDRLARYPLSIAPTMADEDWVAIGFGPFAGLDGTGLALVVDDGMLYVGGAFEAAGDVLARNIAAWDGSGWRALGAGINGVVRALVVDDAGTLYAGGDFTEAGGMPARGIARWDGTAWSPLGTGVGSEYGNIQALAVDTAGHLYAGGWFSQIGGITAANVARWDGEAWHALAATMTGYSYLGGPSVSSLVVDAAGTLYAGGFFTEIDGVVVNHIARWDGTAWSALGTGVSADGKVKALMMDAAGILYAGGYFDQAGGVTVNHLARWDGTSWSALGTCAKPNAPGICDASLTLADAQEESGANDRERTHYIDAWRNCVYALTMDAGGALYAGVDFLTSDRGPVTYIARWDGTAWTVWNTDGAVSALAADGTGGIHAAGSFGTVDGTAASRIARRDGGVWNALGAGTSAAFGQFNVQALAVDKTGLLYAGGRFDRVGGVTVNNIVRWDGSTWSALGAGLGSGEYGEAVNALAVDSAGMLYAGGRFERAGGLTVNHVARWDGRVWSALGSGVVGEEYPATIHALTVDQAGMLHAGGFFDQAGGIGASSIARWDGAAWHPLGAGIDGEVFALAGDGAGNLYAGGYFHRAGATETNSVARWDGRAWSALGAGMEYGTILALAVDGTGILYAGGNFDQGAALNNVARWDGTRWNPLGTGLSSQVASLRVDMGGDLYAAGFFSAAGDMPANYIARWDGTTWSALGAGTNGPVHALALDADTGRLFAGGEFSGAGGHFSNRVAQYNVDAETRVTTTLPDLAGDAGSSRAFQFAIPEGATDLRIRTLGGAGNVNLYVQAGRPPTRRDAACRSTQPGSVEQCVIPAPLAGEYHVVLRGVTAYAGVTLDVSWRPAP